MQVLDTPGKCHLMRSVFLAGKVAGNTIFVAAAEPRINIFEFGILAPFCEAASNEMGGKEEEG